MLILNISGYGSIEVKNVVFDFNGTIAEDGIIITGIKDRIEELALKDVDIYVLTADTYGTVKEQCMGIPVIVDIFNRENASEDKKTIVERLGRDVTVTIGNGRNDVEMFRNSIISIAVIGTEGCFTKAIFEADIAVKNITDAIDLLLKQNRINATLRT